MDSTLHRTKLLAIATCALTLAACNAVTNSGRKTVAATTPKVLLDGKVTGLGGRPLVLQNNGANDTTFTNTIANVASDSLISFGAIPKGTAYNVTIKTQPYGRICTVNPTTASGVANADVTNLSITCTRDPAVAGYTVSGSAFVAATGSTRQVQLHTEDGDEVKTVTGDGALTFTTPVLATSTYQVTLLGAPTFTANNATNNCAVANGSGTANANVTNVQVECSFAVGGSTSFPLVFGPAPALGTGGVGLSLTSGPTSLGTVTVTTGGSFQFPQRQLSNAGAFYTVAITSQPAGQTCVLKSGGGSVTVNLSTAADVTSIGVACIVTPAPANQLVGTYRLNRDVLTFFANGTFLFGAHPATGGAAASGVEQGFYGIVANSTPAGGQTLTITTDSNGAGGLSNSAADFGYVNLTGITKTATTIAFSKAPTFGGAATGPFTYTAANSTAGQLTGAWVTADAQRVFVYDSTDGTGFHMGVNGAANLQDVCLTIADPTAATGSYAQNRGSSCVIAGGVVDTDPFATFGGFYGLPGTPSAGTSPSISYAVTAGSPDTLALTPTGGAAVNWSRSVPN